MSLPLVCIKREHGVANVHGYRSSIYHLVWCCPNSKGIWCPVASLNTAYLYWKLPGRPRYHVNSIVEPLRGRSTNNVHNTNAKHFIHAKQAKRKQKKSTCAGSKSKERNKRNRRFACRSIYAANPYYLPSRVPKWGLCKIQSNLFFYDFCSIMFQFCYLFVLIILVLLLSTITSTFYCYPVSISLVYV